jgi:branched-chain amino acid transport system substrate-binding protein
MMKMTWVTAAAVALGAAMTPLHAQEKPASVGVGVFTFTSGPAAAYGMPGKKAADLMIDQINKAGGIAGVPIKATVVDEGQGTEGVIAEYRRLASNPENQVMIAALSSSNCLALKPAVEQLKVPTIAWNCDAHQLLADGKSNYYFRPNGNTVTEFAAYALYLLQKNPNVKRVAMLNPDYAMGHDAANVFSATLKAIRPDIEVVANLFPKLGTANFQTEVSRLLAAQPDVVFSALWGADLSNFVRQASPRGLFSKSQVILALGETVLQQNTLPQGVIVGVLGDGWWMSPDAQARPETKRFVEEYKQRFGEYPVFPSMKMANAVIYMKDAYVKAMAANGGKWPSRDELAKAMSSGSFDTLTGTSTIRKDNEGMVDQVIGTTVKSPDYSFPVIGDMVRYDGKVLTPPQGEDPMVWVKSINADLLKSLPKPGSYK